MSTHFTQAIRTLMVAQNVTHAEVAQRLGMLPWKLTAELETDDPMDDLDVIAAAFDVPPESLVSVDDLLLYLLDERGLAKESGTPSE